MNDQKSLLRKRFILKRKKFFKNKIIFSINYILKIINKNKTNSIALYYPVNFEANVLNFFPKLIQAGIIVGLPVVKKNYQMIFKKWNPEQSLTINRYGIPEPHYTNDTFNPSIILVPLVAYDANLNRLGYGAGYYDRALKKVSSKKKIISIGVGYSFQKCNKIPTNEHDYTLDYVLNEKKIIYKN